MKLKIFEKEEEKTIYLKLKQHSESIAIITCLENGSEHEECYLLGITSEGRFIRYGSIYKNLGFDLDGAGKLRED